MQRPFEELRERLLFAGVAPRHVHRYISELEEHLADLTDKLMDWSADTRAEAERLALARIGSTDVLAEAMLARPEFRSWAARLPWCAFVLVPPVILAACVTTTVLLLILATRSLGFAGDPNVHPVPPAWFGILSQAAAGFNTYVLPVLLGWAIAIAAARQRVGLVWPILGMIAIAFLGSITSLEVVLPALPGAGGRIAVGVDPQSLVSHVTPMLELLVSLTLTLVPYLVWSAGATRGLDF
ncbi:hypothetical protein KXS07_31435 [Inquilinus limosus]|uniref:hypothetical protein n=1 Tax=Inquilinus limosus TaxID=171674 RepID=UPI003F16BB2E